MPSHLPVSQVVRTGSQMPVQPPVSRTRGDQVPSSPLNQVRAAEPRVQQRASRARQQIDTEDDGTRKVKKRRGPPLGGGDLDEEVELPPATTGYSDIHHLQSTTGANEDSSIPTFDLVPEDTDNFNLGFTPDLWSAIRFTNVRIPNGATITSATLTMIADNDTAAETTFCDVFCEDADNSTSFVDNPNISVRSLTTATVLTDNLYQPLGSPIAFPDLAELVQEVVDRAGWTEGNALTVILRGNSGTNNGNGESVNFQIEWEE